MKGFTWLTTALIAISTGLSGFELNNDLSFVGGFQHGRFKQISTTFLPTGNSFGAVPGLLNPDTASARIDLGIAGIDGQLVMPNLNCFSNCTFMTNFYLTGHALWGWNDGNRFTESSFSYIPTGFSVPKLSRNATFLAKGKLKNARTDDFVIGLGYLFDFCSLGLFDWFDFGGLALGLEGGYSYHKQALKTKHADDGTVSFTNPQNNIFIANDPAYHGTKYHNKWQGGWIGAELFAQLCSWNFQARYQYHIVEFRGINNTSEIGLAEGFAQASLKSNHAHGNVWTLKTSYDVWCGLSLGFRFNYEYWHADKGHFTITAPPGGNAVIFGAPDVKTSIDASWNAYSVAATIGYSF